MSESKRARMRWNVDGQTGCGFWFFPCEAYLFKASVEDLNKKHGWGTHWIEKESAANEEEE